LKKRSFNMMAFSITFLFLWAAARTGPHAFTLPARSSERHLVARSSSSRWAAAGPHAFALPARSSQQQHLVSPGRRRRPRAAVVVVGAAAAPEDGSPPEAEAAKDDVVVDTTAQVEALIADDEWVELQVRLAETVRKAVLEDLQSSSKDVDATEATRAIDERLKSEVAKLRGKDEYEVGDLATALGTIATMLATELAESPEAKQLERIATAVDADVKSALAEFCGKDEYEVGDVAREIDARIKRRAAEFTGKDTYEFGDVSRELDRRRRAWLAEYLGSDEKAAAYQFGDVTKKAISNFTGKDDYQFGDISKKLWKNVFGGGGESSSSSSSSGGDNDAPPAKQPTTEKK